jgi:hypothetical protein
MAKTPREIADLQLVAYNTHDLEAFCALFAADAKLYNFGEDTPFISGIDEIRSMYADRFSNPDLHCDVHKKLELGDIAIDKETVSGLPTGDMDIIALYEVKDSLIQSIRFIRDA